MIVESMTAAVPVECRGWSISDADREEFKCNIGVILKYRHGILPI